jgi:hypothetical protein
VKMVPGANLRIFVANIPEAQTGLDVPDDIAEEMWEGAPPEVIRIGDVVTVVTDPAMVTDRPTKITFEFDGA